MAVADRQAFEALIQENADMLRTFLLALTRDPALADELFHETFMAAWKKLDTYDTERPFGVWLREIASSQAMSKQRRSPSSGFVYFDKETLALLEVQFEKVTRPRGDRWSDKIQAITQCLDALPKAALDLVSLHYHKGYNCREIGNRLGLDLNLVKKRMQKSRKVLFDCVLARLAGSGGGARR